MTIRHTDLDALITERRFNVVRDRTAECYTPGESSRLEIKRVRYIVVHKCSLANLAKGNPHPISDELIDAPAMAGRFRNRDLGTGGHIPYHGITTLGGHNEQMLPLGRRGAHARAYNGESFGWAVIGEKLPAHNEQLVALAETVALLVILSNGAEIVGHCDLQGASSDAKKNCPNPLLDIAQVRMMVRDRMPIGWRDWLPARREMFVAEAGLVV